MISLPIIERELRVESCKRATYFTRAGWGLAAVIALWLGLEAESNALRDGENLFAVIHGSLLCMLLFVAPLVAADSISRERREGTLGLLFLTPLTPREIVLSKLGNRVFRLFYCWPLFLPFLMMPAIAGGVSLQQFTISIAILFSVLIASVAAGMIASASATALGVVVFRAFFFALFANLILASFALNMAIWLGKVDTGWPMPPLIIRLTLIPPALLLMPSQLIEGFKMPQIGLYLSAALVTLSALLLLVAIRFCTWQISRYAETSAETARQAKLRKQFLTPVLWKNSFRRSMSRKLDRNPFIWLEYHSAWARAARWGAVLLLVVVEGFVVATYDSPQQFLRTQLPILGALVYVIILKSANSFQLEKESGAFELILVTPITEERLVSGRLHAVYSYYAPVFLVTLAFATPALSWAHKSLPFVNFALAIVSAPAIGLFFALRCKSYLPALLVTAVISSVGALLVWGGFTSSIWYASRRLDWSLAVLLESIIENAWWPAVLAALLYHATLTYVCRRQAVSLLRQRSFASHS